MKKSGWTLIELLLFGVVLLLVFGGIIILLSSGGPATTATFTTNPGTVQSGQAGIFIYRITQMRGGSPRGILDRSTTFTITPPANGQILSVTDHIGNEVVINAKTATTKTDSNGNVTIRVQVDAVGPLTLSATDGPTSLVEPANFTGTP